MIYKILRLKLPLYWEGLFIKYTPKANARGQLRTKELSTPKIKDCRSRSFQFQETAYWNSLPSEIRFKPSLNRFKATLFKHLITSDHECSVMLTPLYRNAKLLEI